MMLRESHSLHGAPYESGEVRQFFSLAAPMKTSTSLVSYPCGCSHTGSHNSVRVNTRPNLFISV
jgi:hypothetical protein